MRAMILAAGLGTRLKPLTRHMAKPLLPVLGAPMIRYTLDILKQSGIREVVINLHHQHRKLKAYLNKQKDMRISFSYEPKLLDSGGGILKARAFFKNKRFIVINADMLMNIDLKRVLKFHTQKKALATMVLKRPFLRAPEDGIGLMPSNRRIERFRAKKLPAPLIKTFFTGIHVFEPDIFRWFPKQKKIFSINAVYFRMIQHHAPVFGYLHRGGWQDVGALNAYLAYHRKQLTQKQWHHFKWSLLKLAPGITLPK